MSNGSTGETARLEMFSDGVLAIAITLLSLGLAVPSHEHEPLLARLIQAWPRHLAFFTSFVTIGIVWINHHRLFTHIHRVSHGLLLWNGLLLMSVTVIPFTSGLVAASIGSADGPTAAAAYSANLLLTTLAFNVLWRHATRRHRLLDRHITPATIQRINLQYGFGPLLYLASFGVALGSALASMILNCALAAFFALPAFALPDTVPGSPRIPDDAYPASG